MIGSLRGWIRSDMKPAIIAGLLLGSVLGLGYGLSIARGAFDPWLATRRAIPLYPVIEAAWWAAALVMAAAAIAVGRAVTNRVVKAHLRVPGLVVYGILAAFVGLVMVQSDWVFSLLAAIPAGRIGLLVVGVLLAFMGTRLRPSNAGNRVERVAAGVAVIAPLGAAILLLAVGLLGRSQAATGPVTDRMPPNVILITIDALRTDSVGFLSETSPPTPSMDELASRGTVFSAAFVQAPWTLASFASLMTSRYPSEVGIGLIDETPGNAYPVSDGFPTLAELLSSRGYHTVAQLTNPFLKDKFAVCRGFGEVRHAGTPRPYLQRIIMKPVLQFRDRHAGQNASDVTRGAVAWLRDNKREPFFMWIHYLDPHEPYGSPADLASGGPKHDELMRVAKSTGHSESKAIARQKLRELYDREVTYCDHWVGELLDGIARCGLRERTAIILTADHGEAFWEYGVRGHGRSSHDEVLRVPLVVTLPDGSGAGARVERPVRLLDIMPTVLDLAGARIPEALRGRSLLGLLEDQGSAWAETGELFAECRMAPPEQKTLRSRRELTVYQPDDQQFSTYAQAELYPLAPGEIDPDGDETKERVLEFSTRMSQALSESKQEAPQLSSEQRKELEALGYL